MGLLFPIAAGQTDADSPLDQALMDAIRLDLGDHETRIAAVEGATSDLLFDHFTRDSRAIGGATHRPSADRFSYREVGGGTVALLTTGHICRVHTGTVNGDVAVLRANMRQTPAQLPRCVIRMQVDTWNATNFDFFVGLADDTSTAGYGDTTIGAGGPDNGVYAELSGGQMQFVVEQGAARTAGTPFTLPSTGAWFEIDITYTDADSVVCKIDGTTKSTFDAGNVPTGFVVMYSGIAFSNNAAATARNYDIDRIRAELLGLADSA